MKIGIANTHAECTLASWIDKVAHLPERHDLQAWLSAAEQAANNRSLETEVIVVEMPGIATASGRPETLALSDDNFDWLEVTA